MEGPHPATRPSLTSCCRTHRCSTVYLIGRSIRKTSICTASGRTGSQDWVETMSEYLETPFLGRTGLTSSCGVAFVTLWIIKTTSRSRARTMLFRFHGGLSVAAVVGAVRYQQPSTSLLSRISSTIPAQLTGKRHLAWEILTAMAPMTSFWLRVQPGTSRQQVKPNGGSWAQKRIPSINCGLVTSTATDAATLWRYMALSLSFRGEVFPNGKWS